MTSRSQFSSRLELVATPGPPAFRPKRDEPPKLLDDVVNVRAIDSARDRLLISGAYGRITLPALIPGAIYRLSRGSTFRRDFTVKSGELLDLGDISVPQKGAIESRRGWSANRFRGTIKARPGEPDGAIGLRDGRSCPPRTGASRCRPRQDQISTQSSRPRHRHEKARAGRR